MIDVVYPLGGGSHMDDFELRYSLRSLEANLLDLRDVYIVGHIPKWCKSVISIEMDDQFGSNKAANIISKIMMACCYNANGDTFLRASDDQYILKPIHSSDIKPVYNWDMNKYEKWDDNNKWHSLLKRTRDFLNKRGSPAFNYETHIPMKISRFSFPKVMARTDFDVDPGYVTNSIYYNTILDVENHKKIDSSIRAVFMDAETPFEITDKHQYLCHNDAGLSFDLMNYLKAKFPKPSKYERD